MMEKAGIYDIKLVGLRYIFIRKVPQFQLRYFFKKSSAFFFIHYF